MSKLRELTILLILFIVSAIGFTQAPEVEWDIELGNPSSDDYGRGAFQTADGGYIVGGNCNSWDGGYYDNVIFKLNADGDTLWSAANTTSEYQENANMFRLMPDGTYMFCGYSNRYPDGSTAYLYNANSDGSYGWMNYFGSDDLNESGTCVAQVDDSFYVAMTGFWYDSENGYDMKLYFLDDVGWPAWQEHYYSAVADYAKCIQEVSDGGYIVTGSTQDADTYDYELLLLKLSSIGGIEQWSMIGGSCDECGYWVIETSDGGFLVTGYKKRSDDYTKDVYIVKTNSSCAVEWSKVYGSDYMDEGRYCIQTPDGGYVIGASCSIYDTFDLWLLRLDANGDTLWTKVVETEEDQSLYTVDICDDGGYLLCGNSYIAGGDCNMYVAKLGPETSVEDYNTNLPTATALSQNYPNPFNAKTTISFTLDKPQHTSLKIYDLLGREIATLIDDNLEAGEHSVIFDADGIASGTYLYSLTTDEFTEHKRMLLIK